MISPVELEEAFRDFNENFQKWIPDGIIDIDIEFLCDIGFIADMENDTDEEDVTQYFHVLETPDKITLYNEKFAIWIVPKALGDTSTTLTYISILQKKKLTPELIFSTSGVYNSPKFILKVLQYFLIEVIDTEAVISSIGKKP